MIIEEGNLISVNTLYKVSARDGNEGTNRYPAIQTDGASSCDVYASIDPLSTDNTNMPLEIDGFGSSGADLQNLPTKLAYLYIHHTTGDEPRVLITCNVEEVV